MHWLDVQDFADELDRSFTNDDKFILPIQPNFSTTILKQLPAHLHKKLGNSNFFVRLVKAILLTISNVSV